MSPLCTLILRELAKQPMTTAQLAVAIRCSENGIRNAMRRMQKNGGGLHVCDHVAGGGSPKAVWGLCEPGTPDVKYQALTRREYNQRYYWRMK